MDKNKLIKLADDIMAGLVYTSDMCNQVDFPNVFMALLMLKDEGRMKLAEKKPVCFYEYLEKSLPRSLNGQPIFTSLNYLNQEECDFMNNYIREINRAKDKIKKETT